MTSPNDPIQIAFRDAISSFRSKLNNDDMYRKILETESIDGVYDLTDELQMELAKKRRFHHLKKIEPFLKHLAEYASVIEVFLQAKPDVMALIWGPIKLVLQWASVMQQSLTAIIDVTADFGGLLPELKRTMALFNTSVQMKEIVVLIFGDLLEFYAIVLKFFSTSRLKFVFEGLWPRQREKIKVVMGQVNRHVSILRNERQLEHMQQENRARQDALKHFELTEQEILRQEYRSMKIDIAPAAYEDKLNWFQTRFCTGTEKWLLRDSTFQSWLDNGDDTKRFLWLQGIPASGKSFLSSIVVDEAQKSGRTAFVFLSYNMREKLTATSIIHSLIFQLADGFQDIQEILCQSDIRSVKTKMDSSVSLLLKLANCCGPLRLIVDGVDEIAGYEQSMLFNQLLHLEENCKSVRVVVSCRPSAEAQMALKQTNKIQIHEKNSGAIQAFLDRQTKAWFDESEFEAHVQSEIRELLAPLSAKAKGMFLYARVVIDNLRLLGIESVRMELKAPPEDLNDAYARVISRLENTKSSQVKETAFTILGWIGCSPIPLTDFEIKSALQIRKTGSCDISESRGQPDVIQICGPIVEIIDEYVQFVHFTFQEYLFTPHLCKSIDLSESILDLALCCITQFGQDEYGCSDSDEYLSESIICGRLVFHNFATRSWIWLITRYASLQESKTLSPVLLELLREFMCERSNPDILNDSLSRNIPELQSLQSTEPDLYCFLSKAHAFQSWIQAPGSQTYAGFESTGKDPTCLSKVSSQIWRQMRSILCKTTTHKQDCSCSLVTARYGKRPYKCSFVSCIRQRHGFPSYSLLMKHLSYHDQSFGCRFQGCKHERGGLVSRRMMDHHLRTFHGPVEKQTTFKSSIDKHELVPLLFDIVETDCVTALRQVSSSSLEVDMADRRALVKAAAKSASFEMFQTLYDLWPEAFCENIRASFNQTTNGLGKQVLISKSVQKFNFYLSNIMDRGSDSKDPPISLLDILESDSEEIWAAWTKFCVDNVLTVQSKRSYTMSPLFRATQNHPARAQFLISWFKALEPYSGFDLAVYAPAMISTDCPPLLLQHILDSGFEVDRRQNHRCLTELHVAAQRTSLEAAEKMKLLLIYGADPNAICSTSKRMIRDEKGPKGIQKHFGMSWDELVEETSRSPRAQIARDRAGSERFLSMTESVEKKKRLQQERKDQHARRIEARERESKTRMQLADMANMGRPSAMEFGDLDSADVLDNFDFSQFIDGDLDADKLGRLDLDLSTMGEIDPKTAELLEEIGADYFIDEWANLRNIEQLPGHDP